MITREQHEAHLKAEAELEAGTFHPLVNLYPYQRRWLEDKSARKVMRWCRSAGKTWVVMLEAVICCYEAEADGRREEWFVVAQAEAQTKEMIRTAAIHAKAIGQVVQYVEQEFDYADDDGVIRKATQYVVEFESGSRIVGLPCNPATLRGRHGNVIWDEAGRTENDSEIWRALASIANRKGLRILVCSTCGAARGPFYEMCSGKPGWSHHKVDVYQAVAEGCPIDLEQARIDNDDFAWVTEYMMEFEDVGQRLLPLDLILACEDAAAVVVAPVRISAKTKAEWSRLLDAQHGEPPPSEGYDTPAAWRRLLEPLRGMDLYAGCDIGRSRDLFVLWLEEVSQGIRWTRAVIALENRRYAEIEALLCATMDMPRVRRLCIDQGLIGNETAERIWERYGESRVERIQFNDAVKEDLALRLRRSYEDRTNRIPPDADIRLSLNSVYKTVTAANKVRFDSGRTAQGGHADYFWAQALSQMASSTVSEFADVDRIHSFGGSRWSRSMGLV
jgi:phage FluMu gp28-like protein